MQVEERKAIEGHEKFVYSVAVFPGGDKLVSGSLDKTAKVWDLSGNCLVTFLGHRDGVRSVAVFPDGEWVVSGSSDGSARVWDLGGRCLTSFFEHQDKVCCVAVFPDGEKVVSGSADGTAKVWHARPGQESDIEPLSVVTLGHNPGRTCAVLSVAVLPDGQRVVTASDDSTAKVWTLDGSCVASLVGHAAGVFSVAVSPYDDLVVTASLDGTAKIWNLEHDEETRCVATLRGHNNCVTSVAVFPSGERVMTGSDDSCAKVWDLEGTCLATMQERSAVRCVAVFPDWDKAVLGKFDKKVSIWAVDDERKVPLQLSAQFADGSIIIVCINLAGDVVGQIANMSPQDPFSSLAALIQERVRPPRGARWQTVLPGGEILRQAQADTILSELFKE